MSQVVRLWSEKSKKLGASGSAAIHKTCYVVVRMMQSLVLLRSLPAGGVDAEAERAREHE